MSTETTTTRELDEPLKEAIRGAFQRLRDSLPGFKTRRSQSYMVGVVSRALGTPGGRAIAEAPTGTGKSMAYLTPAIPIALAHQRKVVISTATVALQEQVFNRDLPAFLKATGLSVDVALAKGRNRYACPARMAELAGQQTTNDVLFDDLDVAAWTRPPKDGEAKLVERLLRDVGTPRWDGDLDNPPTPLTDELKPMLTVAPGACTGRRCPFYKQCPAQLARNEIKKASVIVSNHDLTIASLKQSLMGETDAPNFLSEPDKTLYVFDEGHTLARIAVDRSAEAVHLPSAMTRAGKLRKLLAAVFRFTGASTISGKTLAELHTSIEAYVERLTAIDRAIQAEWTPDTNEYTPQWRATLGRLPTHWRDMAIECRTTCFEVYSALMSSLTEIAAEDGKQDVRDKLTKQVGMAAEQIEDALALWRHWSGAEDQAPPVARWVGLGSDHGIVCHASEISAAPFLREALWNCADSVVLTSATLSEGGDFSLLVNQLGAPAETEIVSLPSPFDLEGQARLSVPKFPVLPDHPEHPKAIAEWLASNVDWEQGTLVLFTSRRKMQACADALPATLRQKVRVQGDLPKQETLRLHTQDIKRGQGAVLFGLLSLGEGLDLPGELLTHVVCTQIPFAVPTDPVGATLSEWVEAQGGNAFFDIAVPAAIRTLTQFAGRLIRTESDRGTVTLLDRRVVSKRYGRTILDALPPFRRDIAA